MRFQAGTSQIRNGLRNRITRNLSSFATKKLVELHHEKNTQNHKKF
jgi:hypothetical protein